MNEVQRIFDEIQSLSDVLKSYNIDFGVLPDLTLFDFQIDPFPPFEFPGIIYWYEDYQIIDLAQYNQMISNMISAYIQKYLLEIEFIQQFSFSFEIDFNVDLSQFNDFFSDYHPPTIDMSFIEDMNRKTYQFMENSWNQIQQFSSTLSEQTYIYHLCYWMN